MRFAMWPDGRVTFRDETGMRVETRDGPPPTHDATIGKINILTGPELTLRPRRLTLRSFGRPRRQLGVTLFVAAAILAASLTLAHVRGCW